MKEALRELAKYETAVRNVDKWLVRRSDAIKEEAARRYTELLVALSTEARRIKAAAEAPVIIDAECDEGIVASLEKAADHVAALSGYDPNPAPEWLNEAPPPAVGIVEVAEKQGKRARGV